MQAQGFAVSYEIGASVVSPAEMESALAREPGYRFLPEDRQIVRMVHRYHRLPGLVAEYVAELRRLLSA